MKIKKNHKTTTTTNNRNEASIFLDDLSNVLIQPNQPPDGVKVSRNCVEVRSGPRERLFSFFHEGYKPSPC